METPTTTDTARSLDAQDLTILNAARGILIRVASDSTPTSDGYGAGATYAMARNAEWAIFSFLSTASNWGNVPMTDAQLHGPNFRPADPTAATFTQDDAA